MAKKIRKPRSQSPRTYSQMNPVAPNSPAVEAQPRPAAAPARPKSSAQRSASQAAQAAAKDVDLRREYGYVGKDLRRLFLVGGAMFLVLIALNFVVQ